MSGREHQVDKLYSVFYGFRIFKGIFYILELIQENIDQGIVYIFFRSVYLKKPWARCMHFTRSRDK